jgi:hypothetical protein
MATDMAENYAKWKGTVKGKEKTLQAKAGRA